MFTLLHCVLALALAGDPDRFVAIPFASVPFEVPPAAGKYEGPVWQLRALRSAYVALDGPGEAFLDYPVIETWETSLPAQLVVRVAGTGEIRGRVFLEGADAKQFESRAFTLPAGDSAPDAKIAFYEVMERHYQRLLESEAAGSAWFRHRIAEARAARGLGAEVTADPRQGLTRRRSGFDDTFDLFTGERALAENLDLDRTLRGLSDEVPTIDIATLTGVTTRALDWKALVVDMKPELDPLAGFIPADQHAAFFPSFAALVRVIDELDSAGSPLLSFASASAQDQRTKERYQEQLCMPISALSRLLGPAVISSIAVTGGDPFLPSGSDLAVLFVSPQPAVLEGYLAMRHAEAKGRGATQSFGDILGVKYIGVSSEDRHVSSFVAKIDDTIVVTNSLAQLRRIVSTHSGQLPALKSADEYVWFRDRYRRGEAQESALLVLTDAAIRGWAGPRMRIAESRRVRAAAAMAELQARNLDALALGKIAVGMSAADVTLPFSSDFVWNTSGVHSRTWGNLGFLTPISELEIAKVTESEKRAYEAFRAGFESRWRNFFDPIALRLSVADWGLAADMTVMPLVAGSEYREMIELTREAKLPADAGDPHAESLTHFVMAISKESSLYKEVAQMFSGQLNRLGNGNALAWMGQCVALYADRDPIWEELKERDAWDREVEEKIYRMPIALRVDVADPLVLAGFLTALRGKVDESAPDLTLWENRKWHERGYVRIGLEMPTDDDEDRALYYVALPDALTLSLREDVVQRVIDRDIARKSGKLDATAPPRWLGESLSMTAERDALIALEQFWMGNSGNGLRLATWLALPILNEWKQRYPNEDPVRLHERLWGIRLVSPGGGNFVWNEELQTMEATDYGSPALPKDGPALPAALAGFARGEFGLSFEHEGLRARVKVLRE